MELINIKNVWMLTKKNITLYIKKGPVLIFGLMFPFFLVLSWILGREISLNQVFVGIVAMTSFFTATAVSPVILPIETREKSLERLLGAPISLIEILTGIILASTLYSFIVTSIIAIIFLIPIITSITSPISILIIFTGIFLMAILGSIIALLISANPTDQTSDIMVLINLVKFPLIFIGGVFIPLMAIPDFLAIIYLMSPVTYLTELLRSCINEPSFISTEINILTLIVWILIVFYLNYLIHKKTMPKRFSESGGPNKMKKKKMKKRE